MTARTGIFPPFSSKSSWLAAIFTLAFLKRSLTQVVVGGVLDDQRRARALDACWRPSPARSHLRHRLREHALVVHRLSTGMFRMNWNVDPVSLYGRGFCGGESSWTVKDISAERGGTS